MMKLLKLPIVLACLMGLTSVAGLALRPGARSAGDADGFALAQLVPTRLGEWTELTSAPSQIVNPQTQALLDKLYSQVLTRTYVDAQGYRVMLSIAYGDDQRGGLQAHMPEVCYPAQGFQLLARSRGDLTTDWGGVPVTRLRTKLGPRDEPVTYWFKLGDQALSGGSRFEQRLIQLRFSLSGQVPAGMLVRLSSIDSNSVRAYERHEAFARALLGAVSEGDRKRLLQGDGVNK